jgi:hypothetical protein
MHIIGQQAEVGTVLSALGMEAISEYVDPNTGYSFDFYLPEDHVVLEFDGPFHFCRGSVCFVYVCVYACMSALYEEEVACMCV